MAAFASCRRSGCVRVLVVILCALFIFATIGAPPAQALGVESVAVFGLASVLSAATAALGFKLSSDEQGQATLQKMVQDFKTVAWATGFVLVGSKLNGLQNGMDYIKMQVQNGKTYLDSRVFAWVQQWLAKNGVYDSSSAMQWDSSSVDFSSLAPFDVTLSYLESYENASTQSNFHYDVDYFRKLIDAADIKPEDGYIFRFIFDLTNRAKRYYIYKIPSSYYSNVLHVGDQTFYQGSSIFPTEYHYLNTLGNEVEGITLWVTGYGYDIDGNTNRFGTDDSVKFLSSSILPLDLFVNEYSYRVGTISCTNLISFTSNDTGLSGTDTLGKDVVDLTLDQILEKLKEWAQDWYDAGADSATNAATGAKDLPLTVATGAATANPSIAEDGPLVWFPPFSVPIPNLRTGETDTKTVDQGKENVSSVETSTDVAENQSVIDSLVNWALNYISPDTGLFSKFPLCVPYDAYLLVTSSLGVDAVGSDSIFGASPGDLDGVVSQDIETYSDFQPIINIKHDFQLDGATYPLELVIDLTPWQPLVTFFREGMALLLIAELIGAEFKRIRGH